MTRLERRVVELDFFCELLGVSQEVKEVVRYLLKKQRTLEYCVKVYSDNPKPVPHIYVQWPGCALDFTRRLVTATLEKQSPFSFKPKSVEYFFRVLKVLKVFPKETKVWSERRDKIMKVVKTSEKHKEVPIEELLVLLKLKDA